MSLAFPKYIASWMAKTAFAAKKVRAKVPKDPGSGGFCSSTIPSGDKFFKKYVQW